MASGFNEEGQGQDIDADGQKYKGPWKTEEQEGEEYERMRKAGMFPDFIGAANPNAQEHFDIIDRINNGKIQKSKEGAHGAMETNDIGSK